MDDGTYGAKDVISWRIPSLSKFIQFFAGSSVIGAAFLYAVGISFLHRYNKEFGVKGIIDYSTFDAMRTGFRISFYYWWIVVIIAIIFLLFLIYGRNVIFGLKRLFNNFGYSEHTTLRIFDLVSYCVLALSIFALLTLLTHFSSKSAFWRANRTKDLTVNMDCQGCNSYDLIDGVTIIGHPVVSNSERLAILTRSDTVVILSWESVVQIERNRMSGTTGIVESVSEPPS